MSIRAMSGLLWTLNPYAVLQHFRQHRYLLLQLTQREVEARYRGSFLGVLWSLLIPLMMLGVYTFVFSVIFQQRWGTPGSGSGSGSHIDFALALFAGLTAFNLFAETIGSAPSLILNNSNYVKRVVFPLEILPVACFLSSLVQAAISFGVFLVALLLLKGGIPWTVVFLPVALVPLSLLSLGCIFFLSALGVFVRDIGQVIGLITQALLFLSAIFYPLSCLQPPLRSILLLNPLVSIIAAIRRVVLQGLLPDWSLWCPVTAFSALVAVAGLACFLRSKHAFADVL